MEDHIPLLLDDSDDDDSQAASHKQDSPLVELPMSISRNFEAVRVEKYQRCGIQKGRRHINYVSRIVKLRYWQVCCSALLACCAI